MSNDELRTADSSHDGLRAAEDKMRAAGQDEDAIRAFGSAYGRLREGESGGLRSADLDPVQDVPSLEQLTAGADPDALRRFATIKLNGGLATTMGLQRPKSLLPARDGRSFLEIIVGQTLALRRQHGVALPLVLMNSEATRKETLGALTSQPATGATASQPAAEDDGLAPDFVQSMTPKLDAHSLAPAAWPPAPVLEWCPPGHGDVYGALRRSGMLAALLQRGFDYAFISNSDNLGATLDPRIATYVVAERIPFLMEVVQGTEAERKGGHIARRRADGQLVLRELAQTPPEDEESFRDFRLWRYYNTNNLWIDLRALSEELDRRDGVLALPLIVNRKTVDPRDPRSPDVLQLETAMGAAIECFSSARLVCVPRTRFVPVKGTDDLLVLRSDVYSLSAELVVEPVPEREDRLPYVDLDKSFYRLLEDFETRFPDGPPSLREAERLVVRGDITFGAGVVVRGAVELTAQEPMRVAPGTVLEGT